MFRLLLCPVLFGLVLPISAQETKPAAKKAQFQLLKTQHMLVTVKINGKGPFKLIFDTGAPVTLINNKLAKAAGVIPKNYRRPLFAPFGSVGQFKIKNFELGEVKTENIPTVVMDHPTVELMSKLMGPIDGIVGFSFFGRYRMSIDYQTKMMTFVPNGYEPPDVMEKMLKSLSQANKKTSIVLNPGGLCGFIVDKSVNDKKPGVDVEAVYPNSPAAKAGLQPGDRLLVLDDRWTDSVKDCYIAASHLRPETTATAVVHRKGKRMNVKIRVKAGF